MELKATRYEVKDGVAVVTLSRPKRRNAWTGRMHTEYRWILREADTDPAVRVIIVTGDPEGAAFCAGADLQALEGHSAKGGYDAGTPEDIAEPVIAAINGAAAGVGLVLAAFADLRFCAPGVKFTAAHGRFNFPAEFGLSWVLPRIIGLTHANDILLSSRVFTAEEAIGMGFLNRIVPAERLMDEVMAYARQIVTGVAPGSARETKRQIYRDLNRDPATAVETAEALLAAMSREADYREGVKAWMEKRAPVWGG